MIRPGGSRWDGWQEIEPAESLQTSMSGDASWSSTVPSADSGFRSGLALSQVSDQGSPVDRGFSRPSALVSVVLTTLRVDDWLDQAVKSILEQTHVDLQAVVV